MSEVPLYREASSETRPATWHADRVLDGPASGEKGAQGRNQPVDPVRSGPGISPWTGPGADSSRMLPHAAACTARLPEWANVLPHVSQTSGFSPECCPHSMRLQTKWTSLS